MFYSVPSAQKRVLLPTPPERAHDSTTRPQNPLPVSPETLLNMQRIIQREERQPRPFPEPDFPLHAFPPAVAAWLEEISTVSRVAPSLTATPFLAATGALIGSQLALHVGPGWIERPRPLGLPRYPHRHRQNAGHCRRSPPVRYPPAGGLDTSRQQLAEWQRRKNPKTPKPGFDRLLVTTSTFHALTTSLQHSRGVLILRDELFGLFRAMDRRGGEDRQHFLSLWSSEPIITGAGDAACYLPNPVVGIVGGLQPALIPKIRSRAQDGLLERFILVVSHGLIAPWDDARPEPSGEAEVTDLLRPLRAIPDAANQPAGVTIARTPEAREAWAEWFAVCSDRAFVASPTVAGFYRKMPSHLARIALVLHALWNPADPTGPLTLQTMNRAIDLVTFYQFQVHRTVSMFAHRETLSPDWMVLAKRILTVLARVRENDGWITRTALLVALGRPDTATINNAIQHLVTNGIVLTRETRPASGPGRPLTSYRLIR